MSHNSRPRRTPAKSKSNRRQNLELTSLPATEPVQRRDIIVIGGSAGSLGPLKELVSSLPENLPAAIFVTVHVSPESPSILPAILTRAGQIPAVHPLNRQTIMQSTIYVAPPDQHLLIEDGCVLTSCGPRENLHRPAIDPLFRSAARACGPRVMGVILSGQLDDGASGLMAVKLRGGLAVVQDPAEAAFPDMPLHASEYADPQYVLPIAAIQRLILESAGGGYLGGGQRGGCETLVKQQSPSQKALSVEVKNAEVQKRPLKEQLGMPSVYACPDCHGVLWEVKEGDLVRYRCRVGHSYTEETLNVALSKATEDTLWASMRALEEKADLLRRMASRSDRRSSARFDEEAETTERHAAAIRDMLAREGSRTAPWPRTRRASAGG